jgi:glycosyltransferase involved in cell wall biosynthesis
MTVNAGESRSSPHATVILIPAFNEEGIIAAVIGEIREACDFPVLVIDDASTDDTITQAQLAGAAVIPLSAHLGAWGATQTGLRYALRHGYDVAITMDADGQHEAISLEILSRPVVEGVADVAIGACTRRGSMLRRIAWIMMKKTSGLSLEDITSGFRVYNRKAIRELASWRATLLDYQDVGVLLLLQSRGFKIIDVKVAMGERKNGHSRVFHSWMTVAYYMSHTLLLGLSKRKLARSSSNLRIMR